MRLHCTVIMRAEDQKKHMYVARHDKVSTLQYNITQPLRPAILVLYIHIQYIHTYLFNYFIYLFIALILSWNSWFVEWEALNFYEYFVFYI